MPRGPEYSPLPRRDVLRAPPSQPISPLDQDAYDNAIRGEMYRIANNSGSEWFNILVHATKPEAQGSEHNSARLSAWFACGLRYLEVCGLIRQHCVPGKAAAVVWSCTKRRRWLCAAATSITVG
jgi:hypothetical protein